MLSKNRSSFERPECGKLSRRTVQGSAVAALTALALFAPTLPAVAAGPSAPTAVEAPAEAMTQEKIDAANNAYNGVDAKLELITMSDTELGGSATAEKSAEQVAYEGSLKHFQTLKSWAADKKFDPQVIIDNGDVVGANEPEYSDHLNGKSEKVDGWYRAIERLFRESFPDAQVLLTQGNHDIADLMGKSIDAARSERAGANAPEWFYPDASTGYVSNFHTTIAGIDFIGLDYNGKETFGYAGQQQGYQEFLKQTLADISSQPDYDPAQPIFVSIHSGYAGTTLGGPFHGDYDTAGKDLQKILADYPQAMLGSAHTHFSSNPETSIYQKDFTVYENASMNYIYQDVPGDFIGGGYFGGNQGDAENGTPQKSANFVTVMEDGTTVIRRFDVTHKRWIGMPWVVDASKGKESFTYTSDKRSKVAPWWGTSQVTSRDVTETSLTLGFDHAKDDELVNYYEVEITDAEGNRVPFSANQVPDFGKNKPKSVTGSFKAYSRFYMTPNTMGFTIEGLKPATNYTVKVHAFDDFQNKSEALTGTVRTAGELTLPEFPAEPGTLPGDGFLNMAFEGDLKDTGTAGAQATPESKGTVEYVDSDRPGAQGKVARVGAGNKNYIDLGARPEFDLGTDKNFTMSFWANVTGVSGYGSIISNKNWTNWYRSGMNVAPSGSDTSKLEFTLGDDTNGVYATGDVTNYKGSWHMMTFSVDRERNIASTYMDGVLVKEADISQVGSLTSELNMLVGVDGGKNYGVGLDMDDLQMWESTLSADEIAGLYADSDITAERDALGGAIAYAKDLIAANEVAAGNGRVFDEQLTNALAAAVSESGALLSAGNADAVELQTSYETLRAAVQAVKDQTVRYSYTAEAHNGTISPETGIADLNGEVRLQLAPAAGYQIEGSIVDMTGAASYTFEQDDLVLQGVEGKLAVSVSFADANDGGTDPGTGTDPEPGTGGANGAGNSAGNADPGTTKDHLAATGTNAATGWVMTGIASALVLAAGAVLWVKTRLRKRS